MSELPSGWTQTNFTDVFDIQGGTQPPKSTFVYEPKTGYVQLLQIRDFGERPVPTYIPDSKSLKKCNEQDVLIARYGASIGRILTGLSGAYNVAMAKVDIPAEIDRRFVIHLLRSDIFQSPLGLVSRSAQNGFNKQDLSEFVLPLPPLNEQKRIAAKLDALLERVDACRARLERVPLLLKRFRQAVLAAATSGQLTEDWRENIGTDSLPLLKAISGQPVTIPSGYKRLSKQSFKIVKVEHSANELPQTWEVLTIGNLYDLNVLIDFADGNHGSLYPRKEDFGESGALFLTATQIGENWELAINQCPRLINEKAKLLTKGWARNDDVLLTHNATVGRVALLEGLSEEVLLGTSATFYRFNKDFILPRFARILFSSPFFQEQLKGEMEQTTRNQVPITKQVSLHFICPPFAEQTEIVRRVEALFAYADRLEARYQQARAEVERLTPALLAKAFRGELVPQDPNDEPAAALLARLQAERATTDAKPRARAKSNPVSALDDPAAPVSPATQREEPAAGLVAITQPDSPPRNQNGATNGHQPAPLDIDDYDRETLLAAIRDVFQQGARYDTDSAIRTISHALGYARTGARIHQRLKNTLRVAVQRGILVNEAGEYRLDARSIADYTQDECVAALLASLPRGWTEREDAIRAAARYLGFRRTGPALHAAFKSAINGAIRRGLLAYDKDLIRKLA